MSKFKFPGSPGTDHENPFEDERGLNPFSDATAADPVDENPYGATSKDQSRSYQPGDYVKTLPDSSRMIVTFGVIGVLLAVAGVATAAAGITNSGSWFSGITFGIPIQFIGLVASLPAWMFGARDLKAMRAGAMESGGRRRTRIGMLLGVAGAAIGMVPVALWFALLIVEFWYS